MIAAQQTTLKTLLCCTTAKSASGNEEKAPNFCTQSSTNTHSELGGIIIHSNSGLYHFTVATDMNIKTGKGKRKKRSSLAHILLRPEGIRNGNGWYGKLVLIFHHTDNNNNYCAHDCAKPVRPGPAAYAYTCCCCRVVNLLYNPLSPQSARAGRGQKGI